MNLPDPITWIDNRPIILPASHYVGQAFLYHRKLRSYDIKTLREDAHCARMEDVAYATALGARVSQARLFLDCQKHVKSAKTA